MSHGSPHRWVGTTATVRDVSTREIDSAVSVKVAGSTSANTGVRPACRAISGITQKVRAGMTISPPAGRSKRLQQVQEGDPAVGRGDRAVGAEPVGEGGFEGGHLRSVDDGTSTLEIGDHLLGVRDDAGTVTRNGGQHGNSLGCGPASRRAWRRPTRTSSASTKARARGVVMRSRLAANDGRM